jgi:hypothetical protein
VQIPQAAFAVLYVRLDEIARLAHALVAVVALGEFRGDKIGRGPLHDLLVEAGLQFVEQFFVADDAPRFEQRRSDRHIGAALPDAFVDRARRMTDLQPHVPERIENGLGDALAPGGLLVGQQKQEIDVGARRQQPAAIAADRNHAHTFRRRRILGAVKLFGRDLVGERDDRIHQARKRLGAAAAMQPAEQALFGVLAAFVERRLQFLRQVSADIRDPAIMRGGQAGKLGSQFCEIDEVRLSGLGPAAR